MGLIKISSTITLKGEFSSRRVFMNGEELKPDRSLKVRNHSPDGFSWGYSGSGPSQLALAICLEAFDEKIALACYMDIKNQFIANLPQDDFEIEMKFDS